MTAQNKRRITEQRRRKMKEAPCTGYATKDAERKVTFRANNLSPSLPKKFANDVSGLAVKASPRKRKALDECSTSVISPSKKRRFDQPKKK
jgi:hypothetical protein